MIVVNAGPAPDERVRPRRDGWIRSVTFLAAFALGSLLVWKAGAGLAAVSGVPRPNMTLDLIPRLQAWRTELESDKAVRRVGMIGDSMVFTDGPGISMPAWVEKEL